MSDDAPAPSRALLAAYITLVAIGEMAILTSGTFVGVRVAMETSALAIGYAIAVSIAYLILIFARTVWHRRDEWVNRHV